MNVQKLSILLEALRYGSMSKAAEELGYTQSGLSYTISSLESELGIALVNRDSAGIRLSPEGLELLPYMEKLVADEKSFVEHAQLMQHRAGNSLTIGAYPSMAHAVLPRIISAFARTNPEVTVSLRVGSSDEIVTWLTEGSVSFGFCGQLNLNGFEWLPMIKDPELAVLPLNYPTEGRSSFPMEEFLQHPFIMPVYWQDEAMLKAQVEAYKIEPQYVVDHSENGPVISMVEGGVGLSTLPELTLYPHKGSVKLLPLDPPMYRIVGVNYRQFGSGRDTARRFLKCLQHWAKNNNMSFSPDKTF